MTTIATDGVTIAADGLVVEGSLVTDAGYRKIRRLEDGRIVGFSGNCYNDDAFADWLAEGGDLPKGLEGEDFGCLVLTPAGEVHTYDEHGRRFVERPPYAMGSGRSFAKSAMELGKSPKEAVEFACRFDIYSGGTVIVMSPNIRSVDAA